MGCINSKISSPKESPEDYDRYLVSSYPVKATLCNRSSSLLHSRTSFGPLDKIKEEDDDEELKDESFNKGIGNLHGLKGRTLEEDEHESAGWPSWLSGVAGEAIDGWMPMKSDRFKRLEKIGQGTYSNVYRAHDLETGKIFALKKVRFDSFHPHSVRFMAREIIILRKLDHPNIIKLEGIITSQVSCHIYLVFEYMEHDLAGLLSCPEIKFTESQIKCYMQQLLSGIEHCHDRGILHRDIKTSNILINNKGILKIADFGLANFMKPENKQPLTSRVVTLWYRPPELLLGATDYGVAIDMWSVGCVFAEFFLGKPLFKGRTEVEQLHKIFKLCGSPSNDFWKGSELPLANMFKLQNQYESTLREICKEFPKSVVSLVQIFLSIEPKTRGTATSALESKYFSMLPYACDPASLPKYQPNKEIDAKYRDEQKRFMFEQSSRKYSGSANIHRRRDGLGSRSSMKQSYDTLSEASQKTEESQGSHQSSTRSVPILVSALRSKRHTQHDLLARLHSDGHRLPTSRSKKYGSSDHGESHILRVKDVFGTYGMENDDSLANRVVHWEQEHMHEMYKDNGNKMKKGRFVVSDEVSSRQHSQPRQLHPKSRFYEDM